MKRRGRSTAVEQRKRNILRIDTIYEDNHSLNTLFTVVIAFTFGLSNGSRKQAGQETETTQKETIPPEAEQR